MTPCSYIHGCFCRSSTFLVALFALICIQSRLVYCGRVAPSSRVGGEQLRSKTQQYTSGSGNSGGSMLNLDQLAESSSTGYGLREPRTDQRNYQYVTRDSAPYDGRQMSSFVQNSLVPSASGQSDYVYGETDQDNYVAAGGHGHQQESYGHQQSYGKDCNSALALLGVLGLTSYLQSVLRQLTTTTRAPAGRRSIRDVSEEITDPVDIEKKIIPLLLTIANVKDGLTPVNCSYFAVCESNAILSKELGPIASPVLNQLGTTIKAMLFKQGKQANSKTSRREMVALKKAEKAGRSGLKCKSLYPSCKQSRLAGFSDLNKSIKALML